VTEVGHHVVAVASTTQDLALLEVVKSLPER
jgi:hypothetical protein